MKLNKAREELINEYKKALNEDRLPWHSGILISAPYNATNGIVYKGVNRLNLSMASYELRTNDPRWLTFKQASNLGYRVKKGAKSTPIEYWSLYDQKEGVNISIAEANKIINLDPDRQEDIVPRARVYHVFNATQIEGIETFENSRRSVSEDEIDKYIDDLQKGMGVTLYKEKVETAYYSSKDDSVHIPPKEFFNNDYNYDSTLLHELGHATGHSSRLNRNIKESFGSENYAKEELRAEIASSFMCQDLGIEQSIDHINKHKAYVQAWIKVLDKDPNELFRAIKDAEKITSYMKEIAPIKQELKNETIKANEKTMNLSKKNSLVLGGIK